MITSHAEFLAQLPQPGTMCQVKGNANDEWHRAIFLEVRDGRMLFWLCGFLTESVAKQPYDWRVLK